MKIIWILSLFVGIFSSSLLIYDYMTKNKKCKCNKKKETETDQTETE